MLRISMRAEKGFHLLNAKDPDHYSILPLALSINANEYYPLVF